jgi:hypothetical protein
MIYKFRCKATGDLIMLEAVGDQLLRLIGREPAPKGIVEVADIPAAIAALREAVEHEPRPVDDDEADKKVSLRQRVWPMVQMLEHAHAAGEPIVWGV